MKKILLIGVLLQLGSLVAQEGVPQNYENTLSVYGRPIKILEYYYDRISQERAHYYNHSFTYSPSGKILEHLKSNIGLYDTISPIFHNITPPVGITSYKFVYDSMDRLSYFVNKLTLATSQETTQRDEEWIYDSYDMLVQRNYWEWTGTDKIIKNPSYQRTILRNENSQILKIEKKTYSFLDRGLALSEIIDYKYNGNGMIDSIIIHQRNDAGIIVLLEKRYNLSFVKYNDLNTDSLFLSSYISKEADGSTFTNKLQYNSKYKQTLFDKLNNNDESVLKKEWIWEPYKTTLIFNNQNRYETNYDESGYLTFQENFTLSGGFWYSDEVPLEVIEREFYDDKTVFAHVKLWDQDNPFYRKKADFIYLYDDVLSINKDVINHKPVYPNPSTGVVFINDINDVEEIIIISSDGTSKALPVSTTIGLEVTKGLYMLKITFHDKSSQYVKLIIE